MLIRRILTSVILVPLVIVAIYLASPRIFALLSLILVLVAAWEWALLAGLKSYALRALYLIMLVILMMPAFYLLQCCLASKFFLQCFFAMATVFWLGALFFIKNYKPAKMTENAHEFCNKAENSLAKRICLLDSAIGLCVLIPFWIGLNVLRNLEVSGQLLVLYLCVSIWLADSSAYFIGKYLGRKKLIPQVSPNKTRVGVYAALSYAGLFALIVSLTLKNQIPFSKNILLWVILTVITALFSIVGDLFMSVMKRRRSLKDTGSLLPGHGGLLDRIDSLLSATPIFVLGISLLGAF